MERRRFIADLSGLAALSATTPELWRLRWRPQFRSDPFTLGVASGDPAPDGAIIWTRLAPAPLEPDGGMSGERVVVRWEVARDDSFSRMVRQGEATAIPELGHSIHADVRGLDPDSWYFYRFTSGDAASAAGMLRTIPLAGALSPVRFAFASCQHYEQGLYTAHGHLAAEEIDLVAFLGDYIYEDGGVAGRVRTHVGPEVRSLGEYRRRYAQYKSDPALQAAHARCPWIVIWDDHEVDNNYAGVVSEHATVTERELLARRAAGYQAWWEHQPVRASATPDWTNLSIYRTMDWGRLGRFWALDERQYRSDQACGDGVKPVPCGDWDDPSRTMLGMEQERWFIDGLATSPTQWQVLVNQVVMAPPDEQPVEGDRAEMDMWAGYPAGRDRVLAGIAEHAAGRTVIVTGDIHSNWVYDVRRGFDRADRPVIATEFVGTSLSAGGDGADSIARVTGEYLAARPSLKWANNRRGYVVCSVNGSEWNTDYRVVPYVLQPGAPIQTASSWRLEYGRPGVERTD